MNNPGGEIIDQWFDLRAQMLVEGKTPSGARPPSLREACYANALAVRGWERTTPGIVESFVNGLELGAMHQLYEAWEAWKEGGGERRK